MGTIKRILETSNKPNEIRRKTKIEKSPWNMVRDQRKAV